MNFITRSIFTIFCLQIVALHAVGYASDFPLPETNLGQSIKKIEKINTRLRNACSRYLSKSSPSYDFKAVHLSANNNFTIPMRTACLQPLLSENILRIVAFFESKGLVSRNSPQPLLIQILESGTQVDVLSEDVQELETQLNQLIIHFWLSSTAFKNYYHILSNDDAEALISNINRLKSISYLGGLYQSKKSFSKSENLGLFEELENILYQFRTDDAVISQVSVEKSTELACILNPTSDYCPQKIIYSSDIKSDFDNYILLQNFLRQPEHFKYSPSQDSKHISNEFICEQLRLLVQELNLEVTPPHCGAPMTMVAQEVTNFLDRHIKDGQLIRIAFLFNSDRLRKVFPWGVKQEGVGYSLSAYAKDINFVLTRLERLPPPFAPAFRSQVLENVSSEVNSIMRNLPQ